MSYPSQWKIIMAIFPFMALKLIFSKCYYIQPASLPGRVKRPHKGKVLYERKGKARFEDVAHKLNTFIEYSKRIHEGTKDSGNQKFSS